MIDIYQKLDMILAMPIKFKTQSKNKEDEIQIKLK